MTGPLQVSDSRPLTRKEMEAEIERLIDILDAMDGDTDLEDGGDSEPWLGAANAHAGGWRGSYGEGFADDREEVSEDEGCDCEDEASQCDDEGACDENLEFDQVHPVGFSTVGLAEVAIADGKRLFAKETVLSRHTDRDKLDRLWALDREHSERTAAEGKKLLERARRGNAGHDGAEGTWKMVDGRIVVTSAR